MRSVFIHLYTFVPLFQNTHSLTTILSVSVFFRDHDQQAPFLAYLKSSEELWLSPNKSLHPARENGGTRTKATGY